MHYGHLLCVGLAVAGLIGCESDGATYPKGGLYGPCSATEPCETGLKCLPSAAAPEVFVCTRPCAPAAKCPGTIQAGTCRAMYECEQGCCQITNVWSSNVTLTCDGTPTTGMLADGYCQPRP